MERDSEWVSAGDLLGAPGLRVWPPNPLAPGVKIRKRDIRGAEGLKRSLGRNWHLEPVIVDERAYYATLALHNFREEDERKCPACKGFGYVRWERPPGHILFGALKICPRECWKAKPKEGEPWWSK